VQEQNDQQQDTIDWDSIKRTVLEHVSNIDFTEDILLVEAQTEPSVLEIVDKKWVQRVAIKSQKCPIEEHPQAIAVSAVLPQHHQHL
jgi:dihydroneopterin aldolase